MMLCISEMRSCYHKVTSLILLNNEPTLSLTLILQHHTVMLVDMDDDTQPSLCELWRLTYGLSWTQAFSIQRQIEWLLDFCPDYSAIKKNI